MNKDEKHKYRIGIFLNEWNETHGWITINDICETKELTLSQAKELYDEIRDILLKFDKKLK